MNNHQQQQQQQFQQNMQMGSGLTRYRSAPSSYFASLLDTRTSDGGFGEDDFEQLFGPRASSPDTHRIFSRFMNSAPAAADHNIQENCSLPPSQSQFSGPVRKTEPEVQHRNEYSSASQSQSQIMYQSRIDSKAANVNSFNTNHRVAQTKIERVGGSSGLIRHSSSPADLFADIDIDNEFGTMRAMGNFGSGSNANAEASSCSTSRFKSQMDSISEIGSEGMGENSAVDHRQFNENQGNDVDYITGFPINSWDDPPLLSDNFLKGVSDNDNKRFSNATTSYDQKNEAAHRPNKTLLSHHLSLPKSAMEKLLQDSIPCKIRAKRGCATHPRSIAERVRRTKISERMRKLQDLVPNMEKQTNTSDMLDLAVEYIKDLQTQLKTLSDNRAKCSCPAKPMS